MRLVSRLPILMAEKQMRENRTINAVTVARETGLSRPTIAAWIKNDLTRFEVETIIVLCQYFDCDLCDLLILEKNT